MYFGIAALVLLVLVVCSQKPHISREDLNRLEQSRRQDRLDLARMHQRERQERRQLLVRSRGL